MIKRQDEHYHGPRGLFHADILGNKFVILPWLSLKYLVISIIILFCAAFIFNKAIIPVAIAQGKLVTSDWKTENHLINKNNFKKNLATKELPIWHSAGLPLPEAKAHGKRILVMGDSFVWGDGYANVNDIWWRQLERELQRRGYLDVEVIAAGLCGWSTHQQLDAVPGLVQKYYPDLIIWGYVTNDPDENVVKLIMPEEQVAEQSDEVLMGQLKEQLGMLRAKKDTKTADSDELAYSYDEWNSKLLQGKNLELYKQTLAKLADFHKSTGIPGFMMTLPPFPGYELYSKKYEPVRALNENNNYVFYDILDEFIAQYPDGNPYPNASPLSWGINPANGHPGVYSTVFYAQRAADYIENNLPNCLGIKSNPAKYSPEVNINDWMPEDIEIYKSDENKYEFFYPESEENMLRLPVYKPYVQLNLETPVKIKSIKLEGAGLKQATLFITTIHPDLNIDTNEMIELGNEKAGRKITWDLAYYRITDAVNTIRINAFVSDIEQKITVTVIPD